ncbi:histidine phosphatase family protein [Streptomyces sp. A7024]|uniref:Histidine phosphatase family protein n=1 Tax=Streptomyces coryli TaxID=1128680 RepID=A0A6G4TZL8_9ACTN|nr:histidine phosphatase family protein [Streptomyces coryli]NGN64960.1 histidine phosphatase family protein [Streptomyces coryli]
MTTLYLVRHGETVWHGGNRYAGVSDIGLTELGERQAEALGTWAADADLAAIWCSPLSRTRHTAAPAAAATGLEAHIDPDLIEVDFGMGEGRTLAEVRATDPAVADAFETDPVVNHFPGGEDPAKAADRAVAAYRRIATTHPGEQKVLVIGHGTVTRLALCLLLGIPERNYRRVMPEVRNGALTELELTAEPDGQARLHSFNTAL